MTLRVEPLDADAFAPFGRVIERPSRDRDAEGPGWRWWAETTLLPADGRPFGVGYLDLHPAPPRLDWAERHLRTEEAVIATTAEILVYVGPPERSEDPDVRPEPERFRVFRVPGGSGVVLDRGVWHGAPLATSAATTALVLILEGTGRDDVRLQRFDPVGIEWASSSEAVGPSEAGLKQRSGRPSEEGPTEP